MLIQDNVQQVAEGITAALGIETEIIDEALNIVAGTGRYKKKIGTQEEEGNLESGYIYGQLLKSGQSCIIENAGPEPPYGAREKEQAEICCPITLENEVIGLIGLVAFSSQQKKKLLANSENNLVFLSRMAFLIASRVSQVEMANELNMVIENMHNGIVAVNSKGQVTLCNTRAENILNTNRVALIGKAITSLWPDIPINDVMVRKIRLDNHETIYRDDQGDQRHLVLSFNPIVLGESDSGNAKDTCTGAIITIEEFQEVRKKIYNMTDKQQHVHFADILGKSRLIREAVERSTMIAEANSTVLITGESGTGKELFARAIHYNSSRNREPFITVNCGAIPENLLETELFGYDSGAFTGAHKGGKAGKFEIANKGTIFLDEIGDLPLHLQVKLLHVLQRRAIERVGGNQVISVNVRVIAATNHNLTRMVEDGEFREDLYYRLCVIPLHIPALRERKEDLETLLYYFLDKFSRILNKKIKGFEEDTLALLKRYNWPGNVRELENALEYAVSFEKGTHITMDSIQPRILQAALPALMPAPNLKCSVGEAEKEVICRELAKTGYTTAGKRLAAQNLGISESTLYRRLKELEIKTKK
jgi:transcriptional regulator with PAS, ATPase and Fis domain